MWKRTNDGWDRIRNLCQMVYKTTVDGIYQWRTTHTRWCADQLLMDETDDGIHTRWCRKQLLIDETNEELHIPDDAQKNCWWTRHNKESTKAYVRNHCRWMRWLKYYAYQMMYKTTVDVRGSWRNPCQMKMMYETTVNGWGQWSNTRTRWRTK